MENRGTRKGEKKGIKSATGNTFAQLQDMWGQGQVSDPVPLGDISAKDVGVHALDFLKVLYYIDFDEALCGEGLLVFVSEELTSGKLLCDLVDLF